MRFPCRALSVAPINMIRALLRDIRVYKACFIYWVKTIQDRPCFILRAKITPNKNLKNDQKFIYFDKRLSIAVGIFVFFFLFFLTFYDEAGRCAKYVQV